VIVGQHGPEPPQCLGGDADAELRHIPFQESLHERLPPAPARLVVLGQVRPRERAAQPQPILRARTGLVNGEPRTWRYKARPASDSETPFTRLGEALPSRGNGRVPGAVAQRAKYLEQRGQTLHLVDDYRTGQFAKREFRRGQRTPGGGPLQVEVVNVGKRSAT